MIIDISEPTGKQYWSVYSQSKYKAIDIDTENPVLYGMKSDVSAPFFIPVSIAMCLMFTIVQLINSCIINLLFLVLVLSVVTIHTFHKFHQAWPILLILWQILILTHFLRSGVASCNFCRLE